jgi:hypothetical protein
MAIALGVMITAMKWPFRTALFPSIVSIFLFIGGLTDCLVSVFGRKEVVSKQETVDFQLTDDIDPAIATRRTLVAFAWIIGFFFFILLLGFSVALPLMVFLFLKFQAKERWGMSLVLTGSALAFFLGLFVWLLNIPFPAGWMFEGLKRLGLG